MRLYKFRTLLILLPLLLLGIAIVISQRPRLNNTPTPTVSITATPTDSPTPNPPTHRDLWNSRGGRNYEMTVEVRALPVPPVAQALTIQDGKIIKNRIIGCDTPPIDIYPASDCVTIKTYYSNNGLYTVDELFDMADLWLHSTREFMGKCSAARGELFRDFPNAEAMFEIVNICEADLQGTGTNIVALTAVEYDQYYGYPAKITSTILGALDGTSIITVKSFRLTE